MIFKWDEAKNRVNIQKHKIDFVDVASVFSSPMLVYPDLKHEYGEERWIGIGILKGIEIVVVFTEKKEGSIRIISARKATLYEKKNYHQEVSYRLESDEGNKRSRD